MRILTTHKGRLASITFALAWLTLLQLACIPKQRPGRLRQASSGPTEVSVAAAAGSHDHRAGLGLPSLARTFEAQFSVGVALEPFQLGEAEDLLAHHFSRVTAENQMKLGAICPRPACDFSKADLIADFARRHQMKMTGHALVWHQMYPAWFFKEGSGPASRETVQQRLRVHIETMMSRYGDVVDNWDVVNEAISDSPGKVYRDDAEGSPWFRAFQGPEYIGLAFEYAAAYAQAHGLDVKLYYNDYNVAVPEKRRKIIAMVKELRQRGVRIDGVGEQGHWNVAWPSSQEIALAIDELAAEGLEVKISELDVSIYTDDDHERKKYQAPLVYTRDLEAKLTARYVDLFSVLRSRGAKLSQVTFWGLGDDHSWLNYWPLRRDNHPLLFDRNHQPKPALREILRAAVPGSNP